MYSVILEKDKETVNLGLAEVIPKLQHFFKPKLAIYFLDFTASVLVGNIFLILAAHINNWSWLQALYIIFASVTLFRATAFMHEVYHVGKKNRWMLIYYNFMHGFLHKIPSYSHDTHRFHHSPQTYGTINDPEYDTLGSKNAFQNIVIPALQMLMMPVFLLVRWGIVPMFVPLVAQKGRTWIYTHISTLAMNAKYNRPAPSMSERKTWYYQDLGCFIYTLITAGLIMSGILPTKIIYVWFITFYIIAVINAYRAILNHRYFSEFNATPHKLQIIDSITYPFTILNAIFYPVGLGYHALHHMLPQIPYHNLGRAHRVLLKELPENHPYHLTVIDNYFSGMKQLLKKEF